MKCEYIREMLTQYHLGDLDPENTAIVEKHLEECDDCRAEMLEVESTLDLLHEALAVTSCPEVKLSDAGRRAIITASNQPVPAPQVDWWLFRQHKTLTAAAATGILACCLWVVMKTHKFDVPLSATCSMKELSRLEDYDCEEAPISSSDGTGYDNGPRTYTYYGKSAEGSVLDGVAGPEPIPADIKVIEKLEREKGLLQEQMEEKDNELARLESRLTQLAQAPEEPSAQSDYTWNGNIGGEWGRDSSEQSAESGKDDEVDKMVPLEIELPPAQFVGTPKIVKSDNLESRQDADRRRAQLVDADMYHRKNAGEEESRKKKPAAPEKSRSKMVTKEFQVQPVVSERIEVTDSQLNGSRGSASLAGGFKYASGEGTGDYTGSMKSDGHGQVTDDTDGDGIINIAEKVDGSINPSDPSDPSDIPDPPEPVFFGAVEQAKSQEIKSPVIMRKIYGSRDFGGKQKSDNEAVTVTVAGGTLTGQSDTTLAYSVDPETVDADFDGWEAFTVNGTLTGVTLDKALNESPVQDMPGESNKAKNGKLTDELWNETPNDVNNLIAKNSLIEHEQKKQLAPAKGRQATGNADIIIDGEPANKPGWDVNGLLGDGPGEQGAALDTSTESISDGKDLGSTVASRKAGAKREAEEDKTDGPRFKAVGVNPFVNVAEQRFSTFGIDVDTASYTLARNYMAKGFLPYAESVRTEEFVNFFDYGYKPPQHDTFKVYAECAPSKFGRGLKMLKIGVKGRRLGREEQRKAVLTFLVDSSGSMNQPDRLGLVKKSLTMLIEQMNPNDEIALIQYGSDARVVLDYTRVADSKDILNAIDNLQGGGSTNLERGMKKAYESAAAGYVAGAENRVLLLSDGVANLGNMAAEDILAAVDKYRRQGIFCSVFGFGTGTYDDTMLETLANKGDGTYAFIDSEKEARRVFVDELSATLNTIAKDVKIQVEFDSKAVARYRQLGYENRQLKKEQFRDDTVDAGEVGSGQTVTALYELDMSDEAVGKNDVVATVRVRYRRMDNGKVEEIDLPVKVRDIAAQFDTASTGFRLAAGAAEFSEILRNSPHATGSSYEQVSEVLTPVALEMNYDNRVKELLRMVNLAGSLSRASD